MRVDIIQNKGKKMLRRICHEGEVYVMAPKKGSYTIRLYNACHKKRLAVVTIDGVNVVNGEDGQFEGPGYAMNPWETMEIPGWRRDEGKVASFLFQPEGQSYAAQTGRGTKNVGVIGVAVFDEKPDPPRIQITTPPVEHHHHHHNHWPWWHEPYYPRPFWDGPVYCTTTVGDGVRVSSTSDTVVIPAGGETLGMSSTFCSTAGGEVPTAGGMSSASASSQRVAKGKQSRAQMSLNDAESADVGTGYGQEVEFQTTNTEFERASEHPAEVVTLRYATRSRLESWGVPVDEMERPSSNPPEAFPASAQGCPAPPGWQG